MKNYYIGQSASISKTISETDVYTFAGICGDFNPIHVNNEEAKSSFFKARIAHGMLVASFISTVIGMYLPGKGTVYLKQSIDFVKPVYIGDTITAVVEIKELYDDGKKARLETIVTNQDKEIVVSGSALVSLPRLSIN